MIKIYNGVASEYELPELTPQPRYLYCETITGDWWYKDMKTGKDLPLRATPVHFDESVSDEILLKGMEENNIVDNLAKDYIVLPKYEFNEYQYKLWKLKQIVDNENITGIEARLMIKDLLEKNNEV